MSERPITIEVYEAPPPTPRRKIPHSRWQQYLDRCRRVFVPRWSARVLAVPPEPFVPPTAVASRWHGVRSRIRRTVVAGLVLAAHLAVGRLILMTPVTGSSAALPIASLQVVFIQMEAPAAAERRLDPDPPLQTFAALPVVLPPTLIHDESVSPPSSIAITVPETEGPRPQRPIAEPVADAADFDAATLQALCAASDPATAGNLAGHEDLALLVRVETTGRPSQIRVLRSSGSSPLDSAVSACVLARAAFEPLTTEGQPVAAWRRVVWMPRGPS